ncbi:MAG: efflux RND transporter permease subunit [Bdellovibrionales bacterium]
MRKILEKPGQTLLLLAIASVFGILALQRLPVFLYPKSYKPEYVATFRMTEMSSRDFLDQYGYRFHQSLRQLDNIDYIEISGWTIALRFTVSFEWGTDPDKAKEDFITAFESFRGSIPYEVQRRSGYSKSQQSGGYFAASLYHPEMKLSDLHQVIEPTILPKINQIKGIEEAIVYDPEATNVYITFIPEKLALHKLNIDTVTNFIKGTIGDLNSGSIRFAGSRYEVLVKNQVAKFEDLLDLGLEGLNRQGLKLTDIAEVKLLPKGESERVLRTNGFRSLVVRVQPSDDGNLKAICESVIDILESSKSLWPEGSGYKVIVDPSEFIRSAISNVIFNIFLGGALAVLIFFLFTGSIKSTVFTAIEIPLAIIWAFILMHLFDVSLNLISLGGLALTAGMNIDASVVVVENILRNLKLNPPKNRKERISNVLASVREVFWPVVTSTFSTCIVFLPLAQTSGIAYAILGDLAKAVVFSHGFSAVVALLLVPIVRSLVDVENEQPDKRVQPFVSYLIRVKENYIKKVNLLIADKRRSLNFCLAVLGSGVLLVAISFPFIEKEIIALPVTQYISVDVEADDLNSVAEMAQVMREPEQVILRGLKNEVKQTFVTVISERRANILVEIENKNNAQEMIESISELLPSTPQVSFEIENFNPSTLPIPNPPDMRLLLSGPERERLLFGDMLNYRLDVNPKIQSARSTVDRDSVLVLKPNVSYLNQSLGSVQKGVELTGEITRALLSEQPVGFVNTKKGSNEVFVRFPPDIVKSPEDLASFPLVLDDTVVPLSALMSVDWDTALFGLYQENGQELTELTVRIRASERKNRYKIIEEIKDEFSKIEFPESLNLFYEDPDRETNESLLGVFYALMLSLFLIFSILIWQFGRLSDALMVMVAIPLGVIGVSFSLWVLNSTWSINSLLGTILLGGIAVNNSILLLSFFHFYRNKNMPIKAAILETCETRFRPIIITSLTTIIAMLPIALGVGDGAEVLRPLGIAVCGGMFLSTTLILFIIPCLINLVYVDDTNMKVESESTL